MREIVVSCDICGAEMNRRGISNAPILGKDLCPKCEKGGQ